MMRIAKNQELVDENQRCKKCFRNKTEVSFSVRTRTGMIYVSKTCNACRRTKQNGGVIENDIKGQIAKYFKENY